MSLRDELEELETDWRLLQQIWQVETLQRMYGKLQALSGIQWSDDESEAQGLLQALRVTLSQIMNRGEPANYAERSIVSNHLTNLSHVVESSPDSLSVAENDLINQDEDVAEPEQHRNIVYLLLPDTTLNQFLVGQLTQHGYAARGFKQVDKFLKVVAETRPDVIVMDLLLREAQYTAPQIARELHERFSIPIVFLSQRTDIAARMLAVRASGRYFFSEPIDPDSLLEALDGLCGEESSEKWRVLLVDDTGKYANKYARTLMTAGMTTRILTDPMRILPALQAFEPHLALINHRMVGANALELVTALRQQERYTHLPIILFAEHFSEEAQEASLQGVADDFICEPISLPQLLATVTNRLFNARQYNRILEITKHDELTGLFNHHYLMGQMELSPQNSETPAALLYIHHDALQGSGPLITFEMVSAIVRDTAVHLNQHAATNDIPARLHDSAFAFLSQGRTPKELQLLAETLLETLETRIIEVAGKEIVCTCSIGISLLEVGPGGPGQSLRSAEQACMGARSEGGNCIRLHDSVEAAQRRQAVHVHWQKEIAAALEERRLYLAYQPVAALDGENNAEYYDVLLRLHQNQGNQPVMPSEFMQTAEQSGLIIDIDRWVVENAVQNITVKYQLGEPVSFFLRLSIQSLAEPGFLDWLKTVLDNTEIPRSAFIFDISRRNIETHIKHVKAFAGFVERMGCRFSLRDFDGEELAFKVLESLPVHFVKISNALVQNILTNPENLTLIQRISNKAHLRETAVVAPFVEDAEVLQKLWGGSVDYVAGHLLQAPSQEMAYEFDL